MGLEGDGGGSAVGEAGVWGPRPIPADLGGEAASCNFRLWALRFPFLSPCSSEGRPQGCSHWVLCHSTDTEEVGE